MSDPIDLADILRRLVGDGPSCVAVLDRDLRYVATSRTWVARFGGTRTALEGLRHYDVVPNVPERWKEVHQPGARAGESIKPDEDLFEMLDGRRMWLR